MDLAHDLTGPTDGRLIVLAHGLSSSRASYQTIVPHLGEAGLRVCNADLRGHGESPRGERYRALAYAADLGQLIDSLGAGPAVVAGHSLGGLAASALAIAKPESVTALFLEDPPLFEGDDATRAASPAARFFPTFVSQIRGWQATETPVAELASILGTQASPHGGTALDRLGPERIEGRARAILAFDPVAMDTAIGGDMWVGYDPQTPITCPVTILRADPAVGAVFLPEHGDRFVAANPHASVELATAQAHGIHDDPEGRELYLGALLSFLDGLE